jgi:hypothetical protein
LPQIPIFKKEYGKSENRKDGMKNQPHQTIREIIIAEMENMEATYEESADKILSAFERMLPEEEIMGAVARGWCHQETGHLTMNATLAVAITKEVMEEIRTKLKGEQR